MTNLSRSFYVLMAILLTVNCRVVHEANRTEFDKNESFVKSDPIPSNEESKQIFLFASGKETNTPNFVRLVVMRLIYGLASSMGVEDRLEGALNGVLVPPNADGGVFNFGGFGGDGGVFNFGGFGGDGGVFNFGGLGGDDGDDDVLGGIGDLFDD